MSEVKRYEPVFDLLLKQRSMEQMDNGEYVLHSDYEKLHIKLEKFKHALNKIRNLGVTAKSKPDENEWIRYIGLQAPQIAELALKEDEG